MRRLLNEIADWLFVHSPARTPALLSRVGHLEARMRRVEQLESRVAATEALLDRIGPRVPAAKQTPVTSIHITVEQ